MASTSGPHPDLQCPVCGQLIKVNVDRIVTHIVAEDAACDATGRLVEIPRVSVSAPYECDACGQTTKSNLRTGVIHSHNLLGDTRVCRNSGRFMGPIGASVVVRLLPEPPPPTERPRSQGYSDESTTSVRTVRGGLPSLGRRN